MSEPYKVTYATLTADNEDLHTAYEAGVEVARGWLGAEISAPGDPAPGDPVDVTSPADPSVLVARVRAASRVRSTPPWTRPGWPVARGRPRPGRSGSRCCARWPTSSARAPTSWPPS